VQVKKNCIVSFHYQLSEVGGAALEQTDRSEPAIYLHGHSNILPAMEKAFTGKKAGDAFRIELSPAEAYGELQPDRQQRVPTKHLVQAKQKLRRGQIVQVNTAKGPFDARVIKVGRFNVDIDSSHPLAGMSLSFDIEIVDIREATEDELTHKHAHGPGGHQH
jgi:FKBP-type peptidyl-prolyl cis-trans isomerase SlyD|tara:strand:+ start:19478 stop:19963 length:486 start_codon:yes stop_codon:yes gene_type:complete